MTRGLEHTVKRERLGVVKFSISAKMNHITGFTPFSLMFGREPTIPLHGIVGLPQPEKLEAQDFVRMRALAMARQLTFIQENYNAYYK